MRPLMLEYQVQYSDCKKKLWVHKNTGETVARFDWRFGIDIHNSIEAQSNGAPECLYCTHQPASSFDFNVFCETVLKLFGVQIDKSMVVKNEGEIINGN